MDRSDETRPAFFAPLPATGPWTALGLGRRDFFAILIFACAVYVFWGGPLWSHLGEAEFARIVVSYAVIPAGVAIALWSAGRFTLSAFFSGSGVIAVLKLLLTAGLTLVMDLAGK